MGTHDGLLPMVHLGDADASCLANISLDECKAVSDRIGLAES
jgi:hypothetical protein